MTFNRRGTARAALRTTSAWAVLGAAVLGTSFAGAGAAWPAEPPGNEFVLQAGEIIYDSETGIVTATGRVEIATGTDVLLADSVSYDQRSDRVTARGNVSVQDAMGNVSFADEVELTSDFREGALRGFAALIGENGRLAAAAAERQGGRYTIAHGAAFTPCKICEESGNTPLWQIRARRIVHDQAEKEILFENATFEFMDTAVFYLPMFSVPDPTVRHKSGLLLPEFGTSTQIGTFAEIPYYVSLGDSQDLTISPLLTTSAGEVLKVEYRQRWNEGGFWLQGSLGYDPDGTPTGGESVMSHVFGAGRIPLDDRWRVGFDVQLTSNDTYLKRYDISDLDRLTSDVFVDVTNGRSRGAVTGYFFQSLREADATSAIPFVLPLAEYTYIPEHKVGGGTLRLDASALGLYRDQGTDVMRGSLSGHWRRQFVTEGGQLFATEALVRGDLYHLTDAFSSVPAATEDSYTVSRGLALGVAEWRWPFVRSIGMGGSTMVIEPIVQLIAAPYGGNPSTLPNEDSTSFEFDETNLFTANEFPGLDLWTGGPRSNIGVRVTALLPTGSVEAILGQDFRVKSDPLFDPSSGLGDDESHIVGRFKVEFAPYLDLVHRFRFDPDDGSLRRNEIYLLADYRGFAVDLRYLKLERESADPLLGPREEIAFDASVQVADYWSIFGGARRDLGRGQMLRTELGVRYEDECFIASLGFHREYLRDRDLSPSSTVVFRVGLKTGFGGVL